MPCFLPLVAFESAFTSNILTVSSSPVTQKQPGALVTVSDSVLMRLLQPSPHFDRTSVCVYV